MNTRSSSMIPCAVAVIAMALPAFAQNLGKSQDPGKNWRVYNVEPGTAFFWDINKPQALSDGLLQFPIQQFESTSTGSFVAYLYNNYNADITGKTFSMNASWTAGAYQTRSLAGGFVRFEFQDVTSGPYNANDYWFSTGTHSLSLDTGSAGTLSVSLTDPTAWTNLCGQNGADTTVYTGPDCGLGGTYPGVSPAAGFANAMKKVKMIGLAFGNANRYASGVALVGTTGTFKLYSFTIQ